MAAGANKEVAGQIVPAALAGLPSLTPSRERLYPVSASSTCPEDTHPYPSDNHDAFACTLSLLSTLELLAACF